MTEKENDDCVPFLNWFFCTDYDNDSVQHSVNYILVLESLLNFYLMVIFINEICNQMNMYVTEFCIMSCLCI
jgi:hypothetical protein